MKVDDSQKLLQYTLMSQMLKTASDNDDNTFQMVMQTLMQNMTGTDNSADGTDIANILMQNISGDGSSSGSLDLSSILMQNGDSLQSVKDNVNSDIESGNLTIEQAVDKASQKYNVDRNLIEAVIKQESSFNPNAVSGAGAEGLMQLMPGTAKELGVTDAFNVEQNVEGGTKYLKELLDMYGNCKEMALAAYNAGPGAVKNRGMQNKDQVNKMPTETQDYVNKVMKYYYSK